MNKHPYLSKAWFKHERRSHDRWVNTTIVVALVVIALAGLQVYFEVL